MNLKPVALLTAGFVSGPIAAAVSLPAAAQEQFSNEGIFFETPTIVEFQFIESNGIYLSTFGVENLDTGERTPLIEETPSPDPNENAVIVYDPVAEFEFEPNTPYAFYLESFYNGESVGVVYSNDTLNPDNEQLLELEGGFEGLANGGTALRWDDTASVLLPKDQQDRDFNDFIVQAGGSIICPLSEVPPDDSDPVVIPTPAAPVEAAPPEPVPGLW